MTDDIEDESKGRRLVDMTLLQFPEKKFMHYIETDTGKIDLTPPMELEANTLYRLQLWDDGTASLWQLVADGIKGQVQ